jgi:hypothetical protein
MKTKIKGKFHIEKINALLKNQLYSEELESNENKYVFRKITEKNQLIIVNLIPGTNNNTDIITIDLKLTLSQQTLVMLTRLAAIIGALAIEASYDNFLASIIGNGLTKLLLYYIPLMLFLRFIWYAQKDYFYNHSEAKIIQTKILEHEIE